MNEKELENALKLCVDALNKVQSNQKYQSLSGGKYFTSAPTELEWKRDSQRDTDEIVKKALEQAKFLLNKED